jgi:CIC family chloride channel protein
MDKDAPMVASTMPLIELSDRIALRDPAVSRHEGLLIVDERGQLVGIITRGDVVRAIEQNGSGGTTVLSAGSRDLIVTFPDELLYEAASKMLRNDIGRLPVVSRSDPRRIVGYLGRSNLMAGHLRHLEEEHVRERRFFALAKRDALLDAD